jgi:hypothetical protein
VTSGRTPWSTGAGRRLAPTGPGDPSRAFFVLSDPRIDGDFGEEPRLRRSEGQKGLRTNAFRPVKTVETQQNSLILGAVRCRSISWPSVRSVALACLPRGAVLWPREAGRRRGHLGLINFDKVIHRSRRTANHGDGEPVAYAQVRSWRRRNRVLPMPWAECQQEGPAWAGAARPKPSGSGRT